MPSPKRFPWERDGEVVAFETPEQTRIEHRIAPFGARIAAALMDYLFLGLFGLLFWVLLLVGLASLGVPDGRLVFFYVTAGAMAIQFLVSMFYFVWYEVRGEGRTWGKKRMGIRTVMATGQGLTLSAALVRNVARIVDNLPVLWLVPALVKGHRRLGDLLAGTLVVVDERASATEPPPSMEARKGKSYRDLVDRRFYFTQEMAARLYADDLNLLEHLEARVESAAPAQQKRVREEVAKKYVGRLGLEAEEAVVAEDPGRFLEELYLFLKDKFEGQAY